MFLLMGTWEYKQGNLGSKWILGSNSAFLLREQSKPIFGDKGDFGNFPKEHRPPREPQQQIFSLNFELE